ncbi:MAG: hypothetical protein M1818_000891 [Claussenomyces sp. TS43310]|nr:MAG: hypothetical protein M1818_000891 [Claussenomyces sp. TS43310]
MEALPVELCQEILRLLPLRELKSTRLVSRSLAALGSEYLIQSEFLVLPHRDDCMRLLAISRHATLASHVERVTFDMGEVDEYHARHNVYFVLLYMRDPEDRIEGSSAAQELYRHCSHLKHTFAPNYCAQALLSEAFGNLHRLSAIDINLSRCPFNDEVWQRIWKIPTTRSFPRVETMERFKRILSAAAAAAASSPSSQRIHSLSHDRLPLEFWAQDPPQDLDPICQVFGGLQTLSLGSDSKSLAQREASLAGLGRCLRQTPYLRTLILSFTNLRTTSESLLSFSAWRGDDSVWKHLHTLVLQGVGIDVDEFATFLARHSASLRRLQLGESNQNKPDLLWARSRWLMFHSRDDKVLCQHLRHTMKLDKFNLQDYAAAEVDSEPLYDDDWNRIGHETLVAARLEEFVVHGGPWPIDLDDKVISSPT